MVSRAMQGFITFWPISIPSGNQTWLAGKSHSTSSTIFPVNPPSMVDFPIFFFFLWFSHAFPSYKQLRSVGGFASHGATALAPPSPPSNWKVGGSYYTTVVPLHVSSCVLRSFLSYQFLPGVKWPRLAVFRETWRAVGKIPKVYRYTSLSDSVNGRGINPKWDYFSMKYTCTYIFTQHGATPSIGDIGYHSTGTGIWTKRTGIWMRRSGNLNKMRFHNMWPVKWDLADIEVLVNTPYNMGSFKNDFSKAGWPQGRLLATGQFRGKLEALKNGCPMVKSSISGCLLGIWAIVPPALKMCDFPFPGDQLTDVTFVSPVALNFFTLEPRISFVRWHLKSWKPTCRTTQTWKVSRWPIERSQPQSLATAGVGRKCDGTFS